MRSSIVVAMFTVLLSAAPKIPVNTNSIPGITILDPTAELNEYGFVIRNDSKTTIVSIGVSYMFKEEGIIASIDGVSTIIDVPPGDTILAAPFYLRASNSREGVSGYMPDKGNPVSASIEWCIFSDGTYYGPADELEYLKKKIAIRKRLFRDAQHAGDVDKFLQDAITNSYGEEHVFIADAVDDYTAVRTVFNVDKARLLQDNLRMAHRLPAITRVHITSQSVSPASDFDGWYAYELTKGTCAKGSPAYNLTLTNGCTFPFGSTGSNPPTGAVLSSVALGFIAEYEAKCTNVPSGFIKRPQNTLSDGIRTLAGRIDPITGTTDGFLPRENVYTNYMSNSGVNVKGPDTFFANYLIGIIEPYNSLYALANPTSYGNCAVGWEDQRTFLPEKVDLLYSTAPYGQGQLYATTVAGLGTGTTTYYTGPYGYPLVNRKLTQYCNRTHQSVISFYPSVPQPISGSTEIVTCQWFYSNKPRVDATLLSTTGTPDEIGIFRKDGSVGGTYLLDVTGENQYDPNQSKITTTFVPPVGVLSSDVAVSGDWIGGGSTSVGIYRASTGEWFLDANNNGVWDGPNNGDYYYQYGGIQATGIPGTQYYVPGDVPIVGRWKGGSQSCIGVFRYGYYWVLDTDCNGVFTVSAPGADTAFAFGGAPGDVPVKGDWDGSGADHVGFVRCYIPVGGTACQGAPYLWVLDAGSASDTTQYDHIIGQGIGCGQAHPEQYSFCLTPAPFAFGGLPGDVFITGDWLGIGVSRAGVYRQGQWLVDSLGDQANYTTYYFGGLSIDTPLLGKW